jgi:hypothetical protein
MLRRKLKRAVGDQSHAVPKRLIRKLHQGDTRAFQDLIRRDYQFKNSDILKYIYNHSDKSKPRLVVEMDDGSLKPFNIVEKWLDDIRKVLNLRYVEDPDFNPNFGSDFWEEIRFRDIRRFYVEDVEPKREDDRLLKRKNNKRGAYFGRVNKSPLNLTKYQIFTEDQIPKRVEQCLIHSLILSGKFSDSLINKVKLMFVGNTFAKASLVEVSDILNTKIVLYEDDRGRGQIRKNTYGSGDLILNIALYDNHYFLIEEMPWTKCFIKNVGNLPEDRLPDYYDLKEFRPNRKSHKFSTKTKRANSMFSVTELDRQGYFVKSEKLCETQYHIQDGTDFLSTIDQDMTPYKYTEKKRPRKTTEVFVWDFEADVVTFDHHVPIAVCVKSQDGKKVFTKRSGSSKQLVREALLFVTTVAHKDSEILLVAHNLKYDIGICKPYLYFANYLESDANLYKCDILFNKRKITLHDSLKIIPKRLDEFVGMFNLPKELTKADYIGYRYHTVDNICSDELVDPREYIEHVDPNKRKGFPYKASFNPQRVYMEYCENDVEILRLGLIRFREICLKEFNVDIYEKLTIASVSFDYFLKSGCLNNISIVGGNSRAYVSKHILGGRVYVNPEFRKKTIKTPITAQDVNSLYPSAIKRCCDESLFVTGRYHQISAITCDLTGYVCKIRVTRIGKDFIIPRIYSRDYKTKEVTFYTKQTFPEGGIETYVNKISLEDWVHYHNIEYEFISGIGTTEIECNRVFGKCVEDVFELRLKSKTQGNDSLQEVCKLILNSAYGKTIQKQRFMRTSIHKNDLTDMYYFDHHDNIRTTDFLNDNQVLFEEGIIDRSSNFGIIGGLILSMSRRIMNEVLECLENICGVLYYSDTDSIYFPAKFRDPLAREYMRQYGKELYGKQLGQMSDDLKIKLSNGKKVPTNATSAVFLGKKSYICQLDVSSIDKSLPKSFKTRMKGIPERALLNACGNHLFEFFERLGNDESIEVVINFNKYIPCFKFTSYDVRSRKVGSFRRTLSFKNDE